MLGDLLRLFNLYKLPRVVPVGVLVRAIAAKGQLLVVNVAGSYLKPNPTPLT